VEPALQIKYGIMDGLDVELWAAFEIPNKDAGGTGGFARPQLAVKYVRPEVGLGGFLNASLPAGSEDVVGTEPITTIQAGLLYGKTFGSVVANALASYQYNTQDDTFLKLKQDAVEVFVQGQYNFVPNIGPYLGLDFIKTLELKQDGKSRSNTDGYLLTIKPGIIWLLDESRSFEANLPVTVLGKRSTPFVAPQTLAMWGIYACFKFSLGL